MAVLRRSEHAPRGDRDAREALLRGADQRLERAPGGDQLAAHLGAGQDAVTEPPRRIVACAKPILDGALDGEDPELHLLRIFPAKEISRRGAQADRRCLRRAGARVDGS